jgi:hypothetical protein
LITAKELKHRRWFSQSPGPAHRYCAEMEVTLGI